MSLTDHLNWYNVTILADGTEFKIPAKAASEDEASQKAVIDIQLGHFDNYEVTEVEKL